MSALERLLGGSEQFRKNLVKLASASVIAQLIAIASLPVLSRLYSPSAFGVLTTFTLFQGICLAFVTARFDWLIPNAKSSRQAEELIVAGGVVSIVMVLVLSVTSLLFWKQLLAKFGGIDVILMLPLGILIGGLQLLLQAKAVYTGDLSLVSRSKVFQAITTLLLSILLGFFLAAAGSLVIAYVAGFFVAVLFLAPYLRGPAERLRLLSLRSVIHVIASHRVEWLPSVGLAVVNVLTTSSILLMLVALYEKNVVGWYGLVFRVATAPIGLITTAVVQSFWSDAAKLAKENPAQLRAFYIGSVTRLSIVAVPLFVLFLMGPLYVPLLFGNEWSGAGLMLAAVSPYLAGMIVFSPTTHLIVYGKAHWQLMIDLTTLLLSIAVFYAVTQYFGRAWMAVLGSSCILLGGYFARHAAHLIANRLQIARGAS